MGLEDRFGKFVGVVVFGEDTDVEVLDCDDTLVCEGSLRVHSDLEVRGAWILVRILMWREVLP